LDLVLEDKEVFGGFGDWWEWEKEEEDGEKAKVAIAAVAVVAIDLRNAILMQFICVSLYYLNSEHAFFG
jgi:hypothetical protein